MTPSTVEVIDAQRAAKAHVVLSMQAERRRGYRVRPGSLGVDHGEHSSRWFADEFEEGVSAIGAVLLNRTTTSECAYTAAAALLAVPAIFCVGVDDGYAGRINETEQRHGGAMYREGFDFGKTLRDGDRT